MERISESWQARLPFELQSWVVCPQRLESFCDNSVPAAKWRGYDAGGNLCYYRHSFSQWEEMADDEEPYQRLIMSESLEAWRGLDGRWFRFLQRTVGPDQCSRRSHGKVLEVVPAHAIPRF